MLTVLSNIKLIIEYDGTNYSGWQRQSKHKSVQEELERAISTVLRIPEITLIGAGRTDAGVHAFNQCANFKVAQDKVKNIQRFVSSVNALIPDDISVKNAKVVSNDFHARYSAKKRVYKYLLSFSKRSLYNCYRVSKFDIDLAKRFCSVIKGNHYFGNLSKSIDDTHGFRSIVYYAKVIKRKDGVIEFEICANRFLHSMVRAVVGAMLKVASGKMQLNEFKNKFLKKEALKVQYVPANALYLDRVIY